MLDAGADPNIPDEFTTVYKVASRRRTSVLSGRLGLLFLCNFVLIMTHVLKTMRRQNFFLFFIVSLMRQESFGRELSSREDFSGFTALHYAALSDDFESIQILLEAGKKQGSFSE